MVDDFHDSASTKKVKIVHCCGFDCVPSDMGTFMMVDALRRQFLEPLEVRFLCWDVKGGASGGTIASVMNLFDNSLGALLEMANPFYLAPRDPITKQPIQPRDQKIISAATDNLVLGYDTVFKTWTMPWLMQGIDTRIVNRSNAVQGWLYGREFLYSERMRAPNPLVALLFTLMLPFGSLLCYLPFTRNILKRFLPQPGEGPDEQAMATGFMKIKLWGRGRDSAGKERVLRGGVTAVNGDPGYLQTAKMVSEAALCLLRDAEACPCNYGVLTPSAALGQPLIDRLRAKGIEFFLNDTN